MRASSGDREAVRMKRDEKDENGRLIRAEEVRSDTDEVRRPVHLINSASQITKERKY